MTSSYDVVVVGAGLGGLTVAALLAARGLGVCVLERQSQVGGCIGRVEFSGHEFEPGMGVYTSFGAGEIYEQIFAELPVDVPETTLITQPYVVRLADGTDVIQQMRGPLYEIHGGPATLAERLAESIKRSGGAVRLNAPVLRLAYNQSGEATGVDLLSGETVSARKAIVSNLTIWDTYGKLIGLNRTPPDVKKFLNTIHGKGAYVVYATIEESAISRLPGKRLLTSEFTLAIHGQTATVMCSTDVHEWFTYHASEEEFEETDQAFLEQFWTKLHAALPELGSGIEIIETANPRTFYEQTRRKLGMVMGLQGLEIPSPTTSIPNLFMVGDTVSPTPDLASIAQTALSLANEINKR